MERPLSPSQFDSASVVSVLRNLKIDCTSNTQVIVRSGTSVGSDDGKKVLTLTADKTLDITTLGVNGLDTGSEAANTWYYVYLIWNPTTALVNGLLSASATTPTLPSGYTKKRLIGAVRNDGSSNFLAFKQIGRDVYRAAAGSADILNNGTAGSWTAVDVSIRVPVAVSSAIRLYWLTPNGDIGWDGSTRFNAQSSTSALGVFVMPHNNGNIYYQASAGMWLSGVGFILDL